MKKLAMIGTQIIHTVPYLSYFNGFDPALLQKNAKPWMAAMLKGKPPEPRTSAARFTHIWAGEREEAQRLAESCRVEKVANSPHEFIAEVDAVFVMDEKVEERAKLMRPFLEAGKAVFVDKILSLSMTTTEELLSLAREKGAPLAAWSQLRFASGLGEIAKMPRGGSALASFRMALDILPMYSIHLISAVQGAFGVGVKSLQRLACANGVEVRATYGDGTRVLMHFGPDAPPTMNMCYFAKAGCRLVDAGDSHAMFSAAAAAIEKMIVEWKSAVSPGEIAEASRIVNFIVTARPGEEKAL